MLKLYASISNPKLILSQLSSFKYNYSITPLSLLPSNLSLQKRLLSRRYTPPSNEPITPVVVPWKKNDVPIFLRTNRLAIFLSSSMLMGINIGFFYNMLSSEFYQEYIINSVCILAISSSLIYMYYTVFRYTVLSFTLLKDGEKIKMEIGRFGNYKEFYIKDMTQLKSHYPGQAICFKLNDDPDRVYAILHTRGEIYDKDALNYVFKL